jgi:aldose 1-epimerase
MAGADGGAPVLVAGDWRLEAQPALGGAITALTHAGAPVLRPTPAGATDVLETGCFPLVPYANRIAGGVFHFGGREVRLPVLPRFAPHALHGDGWLKPWTVEALTPTRLALGFAWAGDPEGWPWRYAATQTLALDPAGLTVDLTLTNADDTPMPGGVGLHPYFVRPADARLTLAASGVWRTDAGLIPEALVPPGEVVDFAAGPALADLPLVDHAYEGWAGEARLAGGGRTVLLQADPGARRVQVYAPPGEAFVCVEPVSHRPDALNAPPGAASGLRVLAPGETMSLRMRLSLEPAGA